MGDKTKKKSSVLGRLFGSHTDLETKATNNQTPNGQAAENGLTAPASSIQGSTLAANVQESVVAANSAAGAATTPANTSSSTKNPLVPVATVPVRTTLLTDDDVLYPLPHEHLRTNSPFATVPLPLGTAVSPQQSALSVDSHVAANGALEAPVSRASPVSRLPSLNSSSRRPASPSPASIAAAGALAAPASAKNKLNPVSRALSVKKGTISPSVSASHIPALATPKPRFKMFEDGSHEHNLRAARRQEKLSSMLKDLLGAKKLRGEAKSAVPNILLSVSDTKDKDKDKPPTLFAGLVTQVKNNTSPYDTLGAELLNPMSQQDSRSFAEKYGHCQEVIGRGAFGVVRISHKKSPPGSSTHDEMLYAVKEFKRRPNESEKKYSRRLTSEFCISSSLKHPNIIDTLDLLKDAKGDYCEVMEFCSGGDLYTLIITAGQLNYAEADCFFKQLIRGVNYMHDMGVAHRDLKPENLLLTQQGVLKITDFGNGECFRMAWEKDIQLSEGVCGSSPYIAPEEFVQREFDPRCVDIWACGVIYMAMRTGRQLWKLADALKDEFFQEYLWKRKDAAGYDPIESLKRARCRNVIYSILDPNPERRINGKQILNSEWGREIKVCAAVENEAVGVCLSLNGTPEVKQQEKIPATA